MPISWTLEVTVPIFGLWTLGSFCIFPFSLNFPEGLITISYK